MARILGEVNGNYISPPAKRRRTTRAATQYNFTRSPRKYFYNAAGLAATRAADYIVPGAGTALRAGYGLYKYIKGRKSTKQPVRGMRRRAYHTTGSYKGKFKKGSSKETKEQNYANKGILHTSEVSGTISDPDCVYITHTAVDGYKLVEVAVQALFRKLFQKQGYVITNVDEPLGHISITDAKDWQIELIQQDQLTGTESVLATYVTVAGSTIRSIANEFITYFMQFSSGATTVPGVGASANDKRLRKLILYGQDFNVTRQPVFECQIELDDEVMCVYGYSKIKIQNRTLAPDGGDQANDVSNNPLIGRSYGFKGIPKLRDRNVWPLNSIPINSGIQLIRSAVLTGNTGFKEPPNPSVFSNCQKSAKLKLEPGDIKSSTISFQKNQNFLEMLQKIRLQYGATAAFNSYYSIFPSEMFAFEDMINVNSTQNLSCAYESNQVIGVYFKTKKKAKGVITFAQATVNSEPS